MCIIFITSAIKFAQLKKSIILGSPKGAQFTLILNKENYVLDI